MVVCDESIDKIKYIIHLILQHCSSTPPYTASNYYSHIRVINRLTPVSLVLVLNINLSYQPFPVLDVPTCPTIPIP